jgi:hypothetical protein
VFSDLNDPMYATPPYPSANQPSVGEITIRVPYSRSFLPLYSSAS